MNNKLKGVRKMTYITFTMRIIYALILGILIGLERQLTGHIAGIRINALICMGTCFFTMFPMLYGSEEVFRVGSSIVSGVGFLCSGVIFKENGSVRGMNTAATLWCTSAIGILASTDRYVIAAIASLILISTNLILGPLSRKIHPVITSDETEKIYKISITCEEDAEPKIRKMAINGASCKNLYLNNLESGDVVGNKVEVIAEYYSVGKTKLHLLEDFVGKILKEPEVISAGWEII